MEDILHLSDIKYYEDDLDLSRQDPVSLEPGYLFEKYKPLRKGLYNKYRSRMQNNEDREDLQCTIDMLFLELSGSFDPNVGVDFPYYIKKMLNFRVYHYVDSYTKQINTEFCSEYDSQVADPIYDEIFDRILEINSLDEELILGEKHRELLISVLLEGKSPKEVAELEGVPSDRVNARLYFLIKKLQEHREEIFELYGENIYE